MRRRWKLKEKYVIREKEAASQVSALMLEFGAKLDKSLELVQERCSNEEFEAYRNVVGILLTEMLTGVMNPLYAQHPDLKPKELL